MFDWPRLRRFLGNVLRIVLPFLVLAFGLALITELLTTEEAVPDLLTDGGFWLEVGLDMLPMILAMALVLWFAGRFLRDMYQLDGWREGMAFLLRSRCGLRQFRPWLMIQRGQIGEGGSDVLEKAGGPGHLIVNHDSAVVLERGGRFTRVEGTGLPELDRFERVYDTIDLRPRNCVHPVRALTREGVPVSWDIEIQYQIDGGSVAATDESPYPMSAQHVLRAATCKWVHQVGGSGLLNWEGRLIVAEAEKHLRLMVSDLRLDQLIGLAAGTQTAARRAIRSELLTRLRNSAPELSAKILYVNLGNLQVEDAVTEQRIKAWKANWESWSTQRLAHAEASYVHQYETAKAEAQMEMIAQLTDVLRKQLATRTVSSQTMPQMVLMRLFSVLDRADFAPASRVFFPGETMAALEGIKRAMNPAQGGVAASVVLIADRQTIARGSTTGLTARVLDAGGAAVPDGATVQFSTTLGSVAASRVQTTNGQAQSTLLAGNQRGRAVVTAVSGSASGTTTVDLT